MCCCCVTSVVADSVRPHRWEPTRLPRPWDSPGKNTGVGCHFLLQWRKVKSEREVAQSCPTFSDPMDCSPPGSSVHGILQARVLEWGAIAFSNYMCTSNLIMLSSCLQTSVTSQFSLKKKWQKSFHICKSLQCLTLTYIPSLSLYWHPSLIEFLSVLICNISLLLRVLPSLCLFHLWCSFLVCSPN